MEKISFISKLQQSSRFQVPKELLNDVSHLKPGNWYRVEITEKVKDKDSRKTVIDSSSNIGQLIIKKTEEHDNLDNLTIEKES